MAAVLACGDGAVLSHESAATVWGIRKVGGTNPVHVSVPLDRRIRLNGIKPHRRSPMPAATTKGALPLSSPLFTLVDLAATLQTDPLEAAINDADRLNLIRADEIEPALEAIPAIPGAKKLRDVMGRYTRTDSNLERRFLAIIRKAKLPMPSTQEHLGPGRIDFHWPELNLVVETDGLTYHRTPMQQLTDRKRDQAHVAAGRTPVRIANVQIRQSPDEVVRTMRQIVRQLAEER